MPITPLRDWWMRMVISIALVFHVFFHIQWGYPLIFHSWDRMIPCDVLVSHRPWRRYWQIVNETVWLFGTSKFDQHSPLLSCSSCCSYHPDLMEGALKTLSCAIRTSARTMVLQAWVAQLVGSRCAVVLAYIPAGSIVSCMIMLMWLHRAFNVGL